MSNGLFRDLQSVIASSDETFEVAPGTPGLVMVVFTLPSYEFVFKVIRDTFPASKATTRERIMDRYRQVLVHDRVGRLVDFQEYEHVKFPRQRFSQELLADARYARCTAKKDLTPSSIGFSSSYSSLVRSLDLTTNAQSPTMNTQFDNERPIRRLWGVGAKPP